VSTMSDRPVTSTNLLRRAVFLLSLLLFLTACIGAPAERMWLNAPGWSRAQKIETVNKSYHAPLAVDGEGNLYVLIVNAGEESQPRVIALDRHGELRWSSNFRDNPYANGSRPKLVWAGHSLTAFWIHRGTLVRAELSPAGEALTPPEIISGDASVSAYDVAVNPAGSMSIWFSGSKDEPGVYALGGNGTGDDPSLVDPEGVRPEITFDSGGDLHAVWAYHPAVQQESEFIFATLPGGSIEDSKEIIRVDPGLRTSDEVTGPWLGFDGEYGYVLWTTVIRTGLRAGEIESMSVSCRPDGTAGVEARERLFIPTAFDLPYADQEGSRILAGARVPWGTGGASTDNTRDLFPSPSGQGELAVALRGRVNTRSGQTQSQIGLVFFSAGAPQGYQLLSFTSTASIHPFIVNDADGHLYATWLEITDVSTYTIYLAGTSPDLRETFGHIIGSDVRTMVFDTLFGLVSGTVLVPITLLWLLVPIVLLGISSFFRRGETHFLETRSFISLLLSLGAYWLTKLALFPALLHKVPFAAWIPIIPPWLELPLRIGVPAAIGLLSIFSAWRFMARSDHGSPIFFVIVYGLFDGLLTLSIYGVYMLGLGS
jgi:hypothetical protein